MSIDKGIAAAVAPNEALNIDDLVALSRQGGLKAPAGQGRRERKRQARAKLANLGMIAPLLAAEGCLSLGSGGDVPLDADGLDDSGGSTPSPTPDVALSAQDDIFATDMNEPINLSASSLQANDIHDNSGPLELVRVFDAVNGTVFFEAGVIQFLPDEGFMGTASFKYEVRDVHGAISEAIVQIEVGDTGHPIHDEPHDHNHMDDPSMAAEHEALLDLVRVADATHYAVNNGSWFDPNTWEGGEVPGEGANVVIPDGVMVEYDGESAVSLHTVRVDGMLHFATDVDTFMEVDTLVVTSMGHMTIGTLDNPVEPGVSAIIQIADNGPIDVEWDPLLLSRGVISQGAIDIHGAEKDTYLAVAADPMKGATSITLESVPEGWEVGDKLVITGTHLPEWYKKQPDVSFEDEYTEDEELTITSIVGNTIHFAEPLQYDHDTPRADLKAYVANYSRNVQILTENADDVPVHQRGHVMFMHSDDIDVRYAEFYELGRTDKSERAFDVADLDSVEADTNIKARYSLHLHRAGMDDIEDPAMIVGNAVWGSPGWGYVHHDSNAIFADNAGYDVFGAVFVAETGNETGRWVNNIAIKSIGVGGWGNQNNPKVGADVVAFDLARTGAGFWFQGRLVDAVDNIAAGIPTGQAYVYMSRGSEEDVIRVLPNTADYPEALNYDGATKINVPSITQFENNEAIASNMGFMVVKASFTQRHDMRTMVEDFTAWEVRYGIEVEYTAHYTYTNLDLIASENDPEAGVNLGQNSFDQVISGATIVGFETGVELRKTTSIDFTGDFEYVLIDVDISGSLEDYYNLDGDDRVLTSADLLVQPVTFTSDVANFSPYESSPEVNEGMHFSGLKKDSLGDYAIDAEYDPHIFEPIAWQVAAHEEGYWTLSDGRVVTAFERYFTDRVSGDILKTAIFVEVESVEWVESRVPAPWLEGYDEFNPTYHGELNLDSLAPVAGDDTLTVSSGERAVLDVLANDFDPEGDDMAVDGFVHPSHGQVFLNDDGTVTYLADPNYTGADEFWYWVEDFNGNYTKAHVEVTVEA